MHTIPSVCDLDFRRSGSAPIFATVAPISSGQPALPSAIPAPPEPQQSTGIDEPLRGLATSLAAAIVEVIAGRRPHQQLSGWATEEVVDLTAQLSQRSSSANTRLASLRVQLLHPRAVEVSLHLRRGPHSRAAALRLTKHGGRWLATTLMVALEAGEVCRAG